MIELLLGLGLGLWVAFLVWNLYYNRNPLAVSAALPFPLHAEPRVSILIPARNEAATLAKTLPAFLEQDYSDYQVILADDGSTDGTGDLARSFASRHPGRLRVVRIEDLPAGWVGKTYALCKAFEAADGEWVLATDADMVFHSKALRGGMWLAQQHRAELVSLGAFLECRSFWERLMMPVFTLMLAAVFPLRKINNPRSSVAIASGGYILMRKDTWAGLGGYETIRGEMIDDLNTARLVKHSGRRILVAVAGDLVRTRMYASLSQIWAGLRKNAFAVHRFSVLRTTAFIAGIWFVTLLPLAALAYSLGCLVWSGGELLPGGGLIPGLSLAQYGLSASMHLFLISFWGIPRRYALLAPFGSLLYTAIALDSMLRTLFGAGVSWKSRQYRKSSWQEKNRSRNEV